LWIKFFQPYFCGQSDECSVINSKWALNKAKENIENWFPVVGILEDLETTFVILENKLPQFFQGLSKLYYENLNGNFIMQTLERSF
jgi:dermatan/chondrotin sulfate uronyl 2-O-sulfotransferase UST